MTIVPAQSITSASPGARLGPDLRDRLSIDQDVGVLEVAHLRIEREHDATAQEDAALASIPDQILRLRRRCRLTSTRWRRGARCGRQGRGTCCRRQERAARKRRTRRTCGHCGLRNQRQHDPFQPSGPATVSSSISSRLNTHGHAHCIVRIIALGPPVLPCCRGQSDLAAHA